MTKQDDLGRLEGEIRRLQEKTAKPRSKPEGAGLAMQVGIELVSGVLVGIGIGVVLDRWLGTSPFGLITCFMLGACGGALTIYRTVMNVPETTTTEEENNGS